LIAHAERRLRHVRAGYTRVDLTSGTVEVGLVCRLR